MSSSGITSLRSLSDALKDKAMSFSRRIGDPHEIVGSARSLLQQHETLIFPPSRDELLEVGPGLMRSLGTLFRLQEPPTNVVPKITAVAAALAEQERSNANHVVAVCHTTRVLAESIRRQASFAASHTSEPSSLKSLDEVFQRSYHKSIDLMRRGGNVWNLHTDATLQLLACCDEVYHPARSKPFPFHPVGAEQVSLLPVKNKVQMEAKLQKSGEAREILQRIRQLRLSRVDAGSLLMQLAESGLYDADVANMCCDLLLASQSLLSSQQLAQIVYSLGVLQHRHVQQKNFLVAFNGRDKVTAEGMRRFCMGVACLSVPYPGPQIQLIDWLFMHGLRFKEGDVECPPGTWYIDCAFALSCMRMESCKFAVLTVRRSRRGLGQLSTHNKLRLLYAMAPYVEMPAPVDLQNSWGKIGKSVNLVCDLLKANVAVNDGPLVTSALLHAGVRDHPLIPKIHLRNSHCNPVQQILSAWMSAPTALPKQRRTPQVPTPAAAAVDHPAALSTEDALRLAAQVRPHHFDTSTAVGSVSQVFYTLAFSAKCKVRHENDEERLRPLCDIATNHLKDMAVADLIALLRSMHSLGLSGVATRARQMILERLWEERTRLTDESFDALCDILETMPEFDRAIELLDYSTTRIGRSTDTDAW